MAMGDAILNQKNFEPRARELIILAVMAVIDCPFVLYAHTRVAIKLGLSEEQVALACKGKVPTGLTEEEAIIYVTALELTRSRGPLDEHCWQRAERALGREVCSPCSCRGRLFILHHHPQLGSNTCA